MARESIDRRRPRRGRLIGRARRDDRRGATLITVCITISVLLGMVGVGVDIARAYAFKTQLKTAADAAAMAGAIDLSRLDPGLRGSTPGATATTYLPRNTINGLATATLVNVDAVAWEFNTRTVTASYGANYDPPQVNGIRVVARYDVPTTFARIFGVNTIPMTETTVAALGGVGAQDCLKPWAVHYKALLNQLDQANPLPTGPRPNSYNLTAADISYLSNNNTLTTLLQNNDDPTSPGNIAQAATWKPEYAPPSSGDAYRDAIKGLIPCNMMRSFAPGDVMPPTPGEGAGQTRGALYDFCTANGGATGGNGAMNEVVCTGQPEVKLIMYTEDTNGGGANQGYVVKTAGVFKVKGYQPPDRTGPCVTGDNTSGGALICGFFNTMPTNGGFTGAYGMAFKPAIVL